MFIAVDISINLKWDISPVGAKEVRADLKLVPLFASTSRISSLTNSSSGIRYSPTKALRIDLAIVLSI